MNIALVAHDGRKQELIDWVKYNMDTLSKHTLYATGTTGKLIEEIACEKEVYDEHNDITYVQQTFPFRGKVNKLLSGPLGGDQQIGAMIAGGQIDILIFFCDNLIVQGHQNDVSALTRLASLYNIGFATNRTTADMILTSPLLTDMGKGVYERIIPAAIEHYKNRNLK